MKAVRKKGRWILLILMTVSTVAHLLCIDQFGWFRDELYYMACGAHLAWGYVDHPPLVAAAAALIPGRSFLAVRALPILCGALCMLVTWRLSERMGAIGFGRILATLAVLFTPTYLFQFHTLSMNAFEVVLWSVGALLAIDLDEQASVKRWLAFGAVVGLGLLNKHSMIFWGSALAFAWLCTGRMRVFATPKPWLALAMAALLVAPHVYWQVMHGFPTREFYANAGEQKIVHLSPLGYLGAQVTLAGPGNLLLWAAGLAWLLGARAARKLRFLGVAYLALLAMFIVMHGKAYYMVPFYCVLFAAGGAAWEQVGGRARPALAGLGVLSVLGLGCVVAPMALPILSPAQTIAHGKRLGITPPQAERAAVAELPQHFADMFGWNELVASVAEVRATLPAEERARVQIVAGNYGEAAAIDWLGPAWGLPSAYSPHNAYYMWAAPEATDAPVIVVGRRLTDGKRLGAAFAQVILAGRTVCDHCMPYERDLPVFLCRGWKSPPGTLWPALKFFF